METGTLELKNLIQGFKLSCQTECKSPKTIEWYTSFLHRFHNFLERNNCPTDVNYLNKSHIRDFIRYLQVEARVPHTGTPLSPATIQGYIRTLKGVFLMGNQGRVSQFKPYGRDTNAEITNQDHQHLQR